MTAGKTEATYYFITDKFYVSLKTPKARIYYPERVGVHKPILKVKGYRLFIGGMQ